VNPKCCGQESRLVVQSTNLQYLFCDVCKEEVKPYEFTPPDNYDELLTAFEKMLNPTTNTSAPVKSASSPAQGAFPMFGEDSFEGAEDGFDETIELEPFDDQFGSDLKETLDETITRLKEQEQVPILHPTGHLFILNWDTFNSFCVACCLSVPEASVIPYNCPASTRVWYPRE
jgi:hypothetical protein